MPLYKLDSKVEHSLTGKYDLLERFDPQRRYRKLITPSSTRPSTHLHYVKDIPGKHSIKQDNSMWSLLYVNSQPLQIQDPDEKALNTVFKFKANIVVPDFDLTVLTGGQEYQYPSSTSAPSSPAPLKLKLTLKK